MSSRQPFSSQSILYLLLDYAEEEKKSDLSIILKALEAAAVVAAGVVGGTRLPGVGVGLLGAPFARLLRPTPVRNNLTEFLASLEGAMAALEPARRGTDVRTEVREALNAVVADAADFPPAATHPTQLVVVTWGRVHVLTEAFTSLLTHAHAHARYLNAVHVAGVKSLLLQGLQEEEDMPGGDAAGGVWVTAASYSPDPYTFTALFKSWLGETKGKEPHLKLTIPADGNDHLQESLTLLLDIQEMMLDPSCLPRPIASRLTIQNNLFRTVSTTQGTSVAVLDLEVLKRVEAPSVATALFGQAFYLVPSGATSLAFSSIWENKQYVAALSEQLAAKDEGLLAREKSPAGAVSPLVAIFPATHCSALSLVHVAPAELMLTERHLDVRRQEVTDKMGKEMEKRLESLEVSELRLEDQETSLIPALVQHFAKTPRNSGHGTSHQNQPPPPPPQHPALAGAGGRQQQGMGGRSRGQIGRRSLRAHMMTRMMMGRGGRGEGGGRRGEGGGRRGGGGGRGRAAAPHHR